MLSEVDHDLYNSKNSILETDRLTFHQFGVSDAEFLLEVMNQPDYHQFIGDRGLRTKVDAKTYIVEKLVAGYKEFGFGFWLTRLRETGERVGLAGVLSREVLDDPDVGYAVHEKFRQKGLTQEALSGVLKYADEVLHFPKVCAITDVENQASINLLLKSGFIFSETRKVFADDDELNIYELEF